jgi:hypothetical protein
MADLGLPHGQRCHMRGLGHRSRVIARIGAGLLGAITITLSSALSYAAFADPPASCNVTSSTTCSVEVGTGGGTGAGGTGGGSYDPCADASSAECTTYKKAALCASLLARLAAGEDQTGLNFLLTANGCPPPPADGTGTPPTAVELAQLAKASFQLPQPSGHRSPGESQLVDGWPFSWVNLWTFYWTDAATWRPLTATAEAGGLSATVTATPMSLSFDPGDGGETATCAGPGRPWVEADSNNTPTGGACGYRYTHASAGPIMATTTITWEISWSGSDGTGGRLASLSTASSGQLRVLQIQTVSR